MAFNFKNKVDKDKVFIVNRNKLEKRLDPFYYIPSLMALEEKVKEQKPMPLRHYVKTIASGATPKTTEYDKYYSDKENGIPFLRVQNLSPTGILDTEKVKYINKTTHENYLKRSQVEEGDLLVKITGVGRMAVASVAPDDFVGNTNQHMVVIKTGSKETSEVLAAYLNTDIAEALASRRATGGTRPALDYPALLSIPIINSDEILRINKKAIESKQQKEKQAKELLESIDDYLLGELDINIPKKSNDLKNRIFQINLSDLTSSRFDTFYNNPFYFEFFNSIIKSNFPVKKLKYHISQIDTGNGIYNYDEVGYYYLNVNNIDQSNINYNKAKRINSFVEKKSNKSYITQNGDILTGRVGTIGVFALYKNESPAFISDNVFKIKPKDIDNNYLEIVLNSKITYVQLKQSSKGAVQEVINKNTLNNLLVPIPPLIKQNEITNYILNLRERAKKLKSEAILELKNAEKEIQKIILGM